MEIKLKASLISVPKIVEPTNTEFKPTPSETHLLDVNNIIELSIVPLHDQGISSCMRAIGRDWEWK